MSEYNSNNNNNISDNDVITENIQTTTTIPTHTVLDTDTNTQAIQNQDISKPNLSNVQRPSSASVNPDDTHQDRHRLQQQQISTTTTPTPPVSASLTGATSPGLYTSTNDLPYGFYRSISLPPIAAVPTTTTTPLPTTTKNLLPLSTTLQQQQQQQQQQAHLSPVYQQQNSQSTLTTTITPINDDKDDSKYKLFTIYGNEADNDKLGNLQRSTTGSLSSIITTSIASSEPDPGVQGGSGGGGGGGGHGGGSSAPDSSSIAGINGSSEEKLALNRPGIKQEKWTTVLLQVSIPFFLAGIGTIGAGIILGRVEKWYVFKNVSELFILVPALLGLKGNLDMCLASRLSTQVNLGNMTSRKEVIRMIVGNIALVQVQATVASFLVAMFAVSVGAAMNGPFMFEHVMLLTASAMFTATSSCFVLDFVLVAVILFSQKYRLNPDNLATPLAASIGDVVSISLLSFIASLLYDHIKTHLWITFIVVVCYLVLLPMWVVIVLKNKYTRPVLKSGWVPVLSALCISGLGGLVLDAAVEVFKGFVVFQPIINGIGGNLVSVQASKISTMLHQSSIIGIIPPHTKIFEWPWRALFKGVPYATTARILILMSIPGNIVFIFVADYIHMSASTVTVAFVLAYLVASLIQVMLLLYIAHIIVHTMWKWKVDPDNSSIPYLTALGDLLGSSLLALAFLFLMSIDQEYGSDLNQLNASN